MQLYVCTKCKYRTCVVASNFDGNEPEGCPYFEMTPAWHIAGGDEK